MKILHVMDEKNYTDDMPVLERFAVRGIICKDGKYAMQKSRAGDFKIPGGGIEGEETLEEALIREVREETGLIVKPETIQEIGETLEMRVDCFNDKQKYVAHSYFFFCDVEDETVEVEMTESELRLGYHPAWAPLKEIIEVNEKFCKAYWQDRDLWFLKWLENGMK